MADPLMGAILQLLVQEVYTSLENQKNFFTEYQTELNEMMEKFDVMKNFLYDIEKLQSNHGPYHSVKKFMDKLREFVYDVDDILIDCRIRASMHRKLSPSELVFRSGKGKELMEIKKRIEQLEKQMNTYLHPIIAQMAHKSSEESNRNMGCTTKNLKQSEIIGLIEDMENIKQWIVPINGEQNRIGIVGMGGVGKTTIAQKIFHDEQVGNRFEKRIWVSMSQKVDGREVMRSILEQLGEDEIRPGRGDHLIKIHQALQNETYLIVMDDVWSSEGWWDQISEGLPKGEGCSSCIIITTRKKEVVKSMGVVKERIHRPKVLDVNESWLLFHKVVSSASRDKRLNCHLEEVGKEIVEKCGGLPLAIKRIGKFLSTKGESLAEWKKIDNDFRNMLANEIDRFSLMASLQRSYDDLPAHLKYCILCFSIYPEDYEINAVQLVYWWAGEGFVSGNDPKTALEVAFDCLSELISRCLLEVVNQRGYDGRVYSCKMHKIVRDMIIRMAKKEAFCRFDQRNRQVFDVNSLHLGFTSEINVNPLKKSNSKLRALLGFQFNFCWNSELATVKSLRVLDLSHNKLKGFNFKDLLDWIVSQKRLAYLNLQGVVGLKGLPNSINELRNLQFLVLSECNGLERLPPSITSLQKLTVLDIGNCSSLQNLPQGLGKLSNLQVLSGFKLPSPGYSGCCLGELKGLKQLRILQINISGRDEVGEDELDVLSHLHQLQVLSFGTKDCVNKQILQKLDKLCPPPRLQELDIQYYSGDVLPKWVNPSSLPELIFLCIKNGEVQRMSPDFYGSMDGTWKIEGLCLRNLPKLQVELEILRGVMPLLRYEEVHDCPMLQSSSACQVDNPDVERKEVEEIEDGMIENKNEEKSEYEYSFEEESEDEFSSELPNYEENMPTIPTKTTASLIGPIDIDSTKGSITYKQIVEATRNFSPEMIIGEGGFGKVYKGKLRDGSVIAVKRLSQSSKQGTHEFINEAAFLSSLKHPNLVRLLGWCSPDDNHRGLFSKIWGRRKKSYLAKDEYFLIYEYMENRSLFHLFGASPEYKLKFDWKTRHRICLGVAKGLAYLHEGLSVKIIHRDLKSSNILLDGSFNAKISDLGLARAYDGEDGLTTRVLGTMGYLAPEYAMHGIATVKADVYGFGIVTLEIVSGKRPTYCHQNGEYEYLLDKAYVLAKEGRLLDMVDSTILSEPDFPKEQAKTVLELAMLCTKSSPTLRPTMSEVVSILEGKAKIPFSMDACGSPSCSAEIPSTSKSFSEDGTIENSDDEYSFQEENKDKFSPDLRNYLWGTQDKHSSEEEIEDKFSSELRNFGSQDIDLKKGSITYKQIVEATQNFSSEKEIGRGGFGIVYKAEMQDGSIVAVKMLSQRSMQGVQEFINEVMSLSALKHPNFVQLLGWCSPDYQRRGLIQKIWGRGKKSKSADDQCFLIYEYMENGSLQDALFDPAYTLKLDWKTRHKICLGIAKGLAYVHGEGPLRIIHRDIKASNILLDGNFNAKISDFGLARAYDDEHTHFLTTRQCGTHGYMAPEYAMRGVITEKTDVYSFGVVTLEIVSGKNNIYYKRSKESEFLLEKAHVLCKKGKLLDLVDATVACEPDFSMGQARTMLELAMLCTNQAPALRPTMAKVVRILESEAKKPFSADTSCDPSCSADTANTSKPTLSDGLT